MKIGDKIALCRKKAGLSQEELAGRMAVSRQAVSRWETGAAVPDTEKIVQLSRLFQVSTDYLLLSEVETMERPGGEEPSSEAAPDTAKQTALAERRRRFRIAFGAVLAVLGLATGVAALFLTQFYADSLTYWETNLGKFGTALLQSWRGGMLVCGVLMLLGGAAVLVREYFRED